MHWPLWAKPCCWVGSTGIDPRGTKPRVMAAQGPAAVKMLAAPGWTGQCGHWLTGPVSAYARDARLASGCLSSDLKVFSGFSLSLLLRLTSAFVVGGWMAPSTQNDYVLWNRKARGWVEIVISFKMTRKNIKEEKINMMPEQASNKNERQRILSKVISISGISTGHVLLKNNFALCRCIRLFSRCPWSR